MVKAWWKWTAEKRREKTEAYASKKLAGRERGAIRGLNHITSLLWKFTKQEEKILKDLNKKLVKAIRIGRAGADFRNTILKELSLLLNIELKTDEFEENIREASEKLAGLQHTEFVLTNGKINEEKAKNYIHTFVSQFVNPVRIAPVLPKILSKIQKVLLQKKELEDEVTKLNNEETDLINNFRKYLNNLKLTLYASKIKQASDIITNELLPILKKRDKLVKKSEQLIKKIDKLDRAWLTDENYILAHVPP